MLEISNSVDDAVNLFFDTGGIDNMDIDEDNDDFTDQFSNIINNPRFSSMMQRVVSQVMTGQTDINTILESLGTQTYHPKNVKETKGDKYYWHEITRHDCS